MAPESNTWLWVVLSAGVLLHVACGGGNAPPPDTEPQAVDDTAVTAPDTAVTIDVLANDCVHQRCHRDANPQLRGH